MDAGGATATAHSRYADGRHLIVKEPAEGYIAARLFAV